MSLNLKMIFMIVAEIRNHVNYLDRIVGKKKIKGDAKKDSI